jgi:hypothetical protein
MYTEVIDRIARAGRTGFDSAAKVLCEILLGGCVVAYGYGVVDLL